LPAAAPDAATNTAETATYSGRGDPPWRSSSARPPRCSPWPQICIASWPSRRSASSPGAS